MVAPQGRITLIVSIGGYGQVHHTFHILDNLLKDIHLGTGYLMQKKSELKRKVPLFSLLGCVGMVDDKWETVGICWNGG